MPKNRMPEWRHAIIQTEFRKLGVTQAQFAAAMEIKRSTAGALLRGEIPGSKHLADLADLYQIPIERLMIEPPKPDPERRDREHLKMLLHSLLGNQVGEVITVRRRTLEAVLVELMNTCQKP